VDSLRHTWRNILYAVLVSALCISLGSLRLAAAAPTSSSPDTTGDGSAILSLATISVPPDGDLNADISVGLPDEASYLEARIRMYRPDGRLVYQKTEVMHDVATSTVSFSFERELADLDMPPAAYPVEVRVGVELADDGRVIEHLLNTDLLVHDPERGPMGFVPVVRIGCSPALDPAGRFSSDPSDDSAARDAVNELARYVIDDENAVLSLAIAPVLVEEWNLASAGYEIIGAGGVDVLGPDAPGAVACAETLDLLREALKTGRLELLDVPYADPDLTGLAQSGLMGELPQQYDRGRTAYGQTLETTPSEGTAISGDSISETAMMLMVDAGIEFAIVTDRIMQFTAEATPTGVYMSSISPARALVSDTALSLALADGNDPAATRILFNRSVSETATTSAIATVEFGPGFAADMTEFIDCLRALRSVSWLRLTDARTAASEATRGRLDLPSTPDSGEAAPSDYWPDVAEATRMARALARATGSMDPEAIQATDSAMRAQSRCWAGPDQSWGLIDRGRAHSAAALRIAESYLNAVSISAPDVTLPSASGQIPISIVNSSDKNLQLSVNLSTTDLALRGKNTIEVTVRPSDNFLTIPVNLESSISGRLGIEIRAGETVVASHTVRVQASYLDRLAIIAGVVILLGTLLAFIRKRVLSA